MGFLAPRQLKPFPAPSIWSAFHSNAIYLQYVTMLLLPIIVQINVNFSFVRSNTATGVSGHFDLFSRQNSPKNSSKNHHSPFLNTWNVSDTWDHQPREVSNIQWFLNYCRSLFFMRITRLYIFTMLLQVIVAYMRVCVCVCVCVCLCILVNNIILQYKACSKEFC